MNALATATEVDSAGGGDGSSWKHLGSRNILNAIADHDAIVDARDDVHSVNRPNLCRRDVTVDPVHIIDAINVTITGDVVDPLNGVVPIHGLHAIAAGSLADYLGPARRNGLRRKRPGASYILSLIDDPVLIANSRDHVHAVDGLHSSNVHDAARMRDVSRIIDIPIARTLCNRPRCFGRLARGHARSRAIAALRFRRHGSSNKCRG